MSTGDLAGNKAKLQSQLRSIRYPLQNASSEYVLFYLNHAGLISWVSVDLGLDLHGRSDGRFIDGVYKLLLSEFGYQPKLRKDQILMEKQFAERRILLVLDMISFIQRKHLDLARGRSQQKSRPASTVSKITPRQNSPLISGFIGNSCAEEEERLSDALEQKLTLADLELQPTNPSPVNENEAGFYSSQDTKNYRFDATIEQRRKALQEFHQSLQRPPLRSSLMIQKTTKTDEPHYDKNDDSVSEANQVDYTIEMDDEPFEDESHAQTSIVQGSKHDQKTIVDMNSLQKDSLQLVMESAVSKIGDLTQIMFKVLERLDRNESLLDDLQRKYSR